MRKVNSKTKNLIKYIGRTFAVLGITILLILFFLVGICYILIHGPSETAKRQFVLSAKETSALKWIPSLYLSEKEIEEILNSRGIIEVDEGTSSNLDLVKVDDNSTDKGSPLEVIDIKGDTFRGKLMIIKDPSRVYLGTIDIFYEGPGLTVQEMCERQNAVAGVNGGEFLDRGTVAYSGLPVGGVIKDGKIINGEPSDVSNFTGLTYDNKLIIGKMSAQAALDKGMRDGVNTLTHTGPFLILDGEVLFEEGTDTVAGGKNPRTAIGQRADGAILLLVVDGRQADSLGATFAEVAYVLKDHGAINASCMDGGTSTQMVLDNEILNSPYSPYGPRRCPTAWLVKPEKTN